LALLLPTVDYGTIALVKDHRVRLDDEELAVVVSALRARMAGSGPLRRKALQRLADRL